MAQTIDIYIDDLYCPEPQRIGLLHAEPSKGREVFDFEFDDRWLHDGRPYILDPDLQLYKGRQFLEEGKSNFGIFLDSSPDRWGRLLLDRREAIRARMESRQPRTLLESDYLLGVFDECRMGALRFKTRTDRGYMDSDPELSIPPIASLRELEHASWQLEHDDTTAASRWIQLLLAPGSSLGGARPKANVRDNNGHLWIAKFPSRHDTTNVGAWEAVAMTLAGRCNIQVAPYSAQAFSNRFSTFLTRRFDRDNNNKRIHFTSAMTMLGYSDGHTDGCSYLEMAEWICQHCCHVEDNLAQLWQRIVFNIAISNSDDHLRNHGFLLTRDGWTLSPAYDLNPQMKATGLCLNINEKDNSLDYRLAKDVAPFFGVSDTKADSIIQNTKHVVSSWRSLAGKQGIPRAEQELMATAFH